MSDSEQQVPPARAQGSNQASIPVGPSAECGAAGGVGDGDANPEGACASWGRGGVA